GWRRSGPGDPKRPPGRRGNGRNGCGCRELLLEDRVGGIGAIGAASGAIHTHGHSAVHRLNLERVAGFAVTLDFELHGYGLGFSSVTPDGIARGAEASAGLD